MSTKKQPLKQGEKVLLGISGAFILAAVVGYTALETFRLKADKPIFQVATHFELSPEGHRGSALFRESRCTSCHRAMRNGTNMGLSLDGLGSKRSLGWIKSFLADPERTYGAPTFDHGAPPKEAAYVARLPNEDLTAISVFLSELKSDRGSSSAPLPPRGDSAFIDGMVKLWAPEGWKEKYRDVRDASKDEEVSGRGE